MRGNTTAVLVLLGSMALFATGCNKLKARDNLNQGTNAFKAGQFADAADHFKTAIALDPTFDVARLYLATAYLQQYIPGTDTPENKKYADSAMEEFQKVLQTDPKNKLATQNIASLYYSMRDFPKATEWNKKVVEIDPNNKEAYYTLGVIPWTEFIVPDRETRNAAGMTPEAPPPIKDAKARAELKAKYWDSLTQAIEYEKKALAADPEYENAMSYMNLLIRYRADLDDTKQQADADTKEADMWLQKSLETTKIKADRKAKNPNAK